MCLICGALGSANTELKKKYKDTIPPCHLDFFLPSLFHSLNDPHIHQVFVDEEAYSCLPSSFMSLKDEFVPLRTTGDGNCLTSALSRAMWGSETWSASLRTLLFNELNQNEKFYRAIVIKNSIWEVENEDLYWEKEFKIPAQTPKAYLNGVHIFALSNALKRPIILYGSDEFAGRFGTGIHGVAATFLPTLVSKEEQVSKIPIAIAWGTKNHNHFVPLVGMEGKKRPIWPILPSAFDHDVNGRIQYTNNKLLELMDNPFAEELVTCYSSMKSEERDYDKYIASLIEKIQDKRNTESLVEHLEGLSEKLKGSENVHKRLKWRIGDEYYDGWVPVVLSTKSSSGIIDLDTVKCGFNYDNDPDTIEKEFITKRKLILSSQSTGAIANDIRKKIMEHSNNVHSVYSISTKPGPSAHGFRYILDGNEYDFLVRFTGGFLLPFNTGDDIDHRVEQFIEKNGIDSQYRNIIRQITCRVIEDTPSSKTAPVKKRKITEITTHYKHFGISRPLETYLQLPNGWGSLISDRIKRLFGESLGNSIVTKISEGSGTLNDGEMDWLLTNSVELPDETVPVIFDLLRSSFLLPTSCNDIVRAMRDTNYITKWCERIISLCDGMKKAYLGTVRLILRVLANMLVKGKSREIVIENISTVIDCLNVITTSERCHSSSDFCCVISTVVFNYLFQVKTDKYLLKQCHDIVVTILNHEEKPLEGRAALRSLACIGTIFILLPEIDSSGMDTVLVRLMPTDYSQNSNTIVECCADLRHLIETLQSLHIHN